MSTVKEIEAIIPRLSRVEVEEDYIIVEFRRERGQLDASMA
jgi:hypothetical protein